jgi:hypothetical protein
MGAAGGMTAPENGDGLNIYGNKVSMLRLEVRDVAP